MAQAKSTMAHSGRFSDEDGHPVAGLEALLPHGQGQALHLGLELLVGDRPEFSVRLVGKGVGQIVRDGFVEQFGDGLDQPGTPEARW